MYSVIILLMSMIIGIPSHSGMTIVSNDLPRTSRCVEISHSKLLTYKIESRGSKSRYSQHYKDDKYYGHNSTPVVFVSCFTKGDPIFWISSPLGSATGYGSSSVPSLRLPMPGAVTGSHLHPSSWLCCFMGVSINGYPKLWMVYQWKIPV